MELLNVITSNIWLILLVVGMLLFKPYRFAAFILLATKLMMGYTPSWIVVTVVAIACIFDVYNYTHQNTPTTPEPPVIINSDKVVPINDKKNKVDIDLSKCTNWDNVSTERNFDLLDE